MLGSRARTFVAPLIVAVLVRIGCMLAFAPDLFPIGDSNGYLVLARQYAETGELSALMEGVRPPLQQIIMAWGLDTSVAPADPYPGVFLIQIAFDLVTCVGLMHIARRRFGDRAGVATGWIYALLPTAALYASVVIMLESLTCAFTTVALVLLDHLLDRWEGSGLRRAAWAAALGVVLGAGMLVKEQMLVVAGALGLVLLLRARTPLREKLAASSVLVLLLVLVMTPWVRHTERVYGMPLPLGSFGIMGLMMDNMRDGSDGYAAWRAIPDRQERAARAREVFRGALTEWPWLTAQRALSRLRVVAGPENELPIAFALPLEGAIPDTSGLSAMYEWLWHMRGPWGRGVQVICGIGTFVLFVLGAAGVAARASGPLARVALIATSATLLGVALTASLPRYRQGLVPFFAPFAGLVVVALVDRLSLSAPERRRALLAGLVAAVVLGMTIFVLPAPAPVLS